MSRTKLHERKLDPAILASIDRAQRREPKKCALCDKKAIFMVRRGGRWIGGCFDHKPQAELSSMSMDYEDEE